MQQAWNGIRQCPYIMANDMPKVQAGFSRRSGSPRRWRRRTRVHELGLGTTCGGWRLHRARHPPTFGQLASRGDSFTPLWRIVGEARDRDRG